MFGIDCDIVESLEYCYDNFNGKTTANKPLKTDQLVKMHHYYNVVTMNGEKLKNIREKTGYSRKELAERILVTEYVVQSWEEGWYITQPSSGEIEGLAEMFNLSEEELCNVLSVENSNQGCFLPCKNRDRSPTDPIPILISLLTQKRRNPAYQAHRTLYRC